MVYAEAAEFYEKRIFQAANCGVVARTLLVSLVGGVEVPRTQEIPAIDALSYRACSRARPSSERHESLRNIGFPKSRYE